jgi:hypothetical protein
MRNAYRTLIGKSERKRPLRRPRCMRKDDIKMYHVINRVGGFGLDKSGSGQGPMAGFCEHANEPSGSKRSWEFF